MKSADPNKAALFGEAVLTVSLDIELLHFAPLVSTHWHGEIKGGMGEGKKSEGSGEDGQPARTAPSECSDHASSRMSSSPFVTSLQMLGTFKNTRRLVHAASLLPGPGKKTSRRRMSRPYNLPTGSARSIPATFRAKRRYRLRTL